MAERDAAVAIVHARTTDAVLLMRRAERAEDPWSGHWSFPGGRYENEDGDLLHTAVRELEEECGIRVGDAQLETELPPAVARRRTGPYLHVAPFVFRVDAEPALILDPGEAAEALWMPLDVLCDPARHALLPVPGLPPEMRFPAIDVKGVPLWGFTYRLITEWLNLVPRKRPIEEPGCEAAQALLDHLVSNGCRLVQSWIDRDGIQVAHVSGSIPVDVAWRASATHDHIPWVSMMEVRPDQVRLVGLAFEEYLITTD